MSLHLASKPCVRVCVREGEEKFYWPSAKFEKGACLIMGPPYNDFYDQYKKINSALELEPWVSPAFLKIAKARMRTWNLLLFCLFSLSKAAP